MNASMPSSRYVPAPWQQLRDEGRRLGTESSPRLRGDKDVLQSVKLHAGKWGQRGGANVFATTSSKAMMPKFYAGGSIKWNASLFDLANQLARPDRDIYQFGVYTGTTLKLIGERISGFGSLWAFDSFQGFPEEDTSRGAARVKGWNAGRDSASDALGIHSTHELLRRLRQLVGQAVSNKTTFIQGFYNESLTDALARHHSFQPALLVDLDCDLHVSTMDAFKWLMRHRLLMPLSLVRYDDFGAPGMVGSSPQALAHEQASARWGLEWRSLGATRSARAFQLLSIGKPAGLFTGVF